MMRNGVANLYEEIDLPLSRIRRRARLDFFGLRDQVLFKGLRAPRMAAALTSFPPSQGHSFTVVSDLRLG
jgi:hypothetical protein